MESVVLSAAVIDGTLRMGLILKHQLETNTNDLLEEFLYQEEEEKGISEREIYRRALAKKKPLKRPMTNLMPSTIYETELSIAILLA